MPIVPAVEFELHDATFSAYVRPASGSTQLCAWRLQIPPHVTGVAHRPNREEVLLVLAGSFTMHLDGTPHSVTPGDVLFMPADAELRVDTGADGGSAWVSTTVGLQATTPDGATITPPWAQ